MALRTAYFLDPRVEPATVPLEEASKALGVADPLPVGLTCFLFLGGRLALWPVDKPGDGVSLGIAPYYHFSAHFPTRPLFVLMASSKS